MSGEIALDTSAAIRFLNGDTTITNVYYIVRKVVAQDAIAQILSDLNICAVNLNVLEQALALNFEDFEREKKLKNVYPIYR